MESEDQEKFNMSLTYQHGINGFSGEAKRRPYIYWWENNSSDGYGQIIATCKLAPHNTVIHN